MINCTVYYFGWQLYLWLHFSVCILTWHVNLINKPFSSSFWSGEVYEWNRVMKITINGYNRLLSSTSSTVPPFHESLLTPFCHILETNEWRSSLRCCWVIHMCWWRHRVVYCKALKYLLFFLSVPPSRKYQSDTLFTRVTWPIWRAYHTHTITSVSWNMAGYILCYELVSRLHAILYSVLMLLQDRIFTH